LVDLQACYFASRYVKTNNENQYADFLSQNLTSGQDATLVFCQPNGAPNDATFIHGGQDVTLY